MSRYTYRAIISILFCSLSWTLSGQDIHFSQFYNADHLLSPALTGIFNGDVRMMGHYRRQWENVPVDYITFSGTYDMKYYPRQLTSNDFWGFGLNFNYDKAGFSKLRLTELRLGGSYTKEINTNAFLTGGLQLGLSQRSLDEDQLNFDNQYNGEQFDPTLPTGEDFSNTSIFFVDASVGGNLRLQADNRRSKVDLGVGWFHINKPKQDFFDANTDIRLPSRVTLYGLGALKLINPLDLVGHVGYQFQGPLNELTAGLGLKVYLDQSRGKELALQLGGNIRLNEITDAIVPAVELHYKTLGIGFSYDINISDFDIATDNRGGPEIWISYRIARVKPLSAFKTCPIF